MIHAFQDIKRVGPLVRGATVNAFDGGGNPVSVNLLVDTGASRTLVSEAALRSIGVEPHSYRPLHHVGGKSDRNLPMFRVTISVPGVNDDGSVGSWVFGLNNVAGISGPVVSEYDGFLGRDFMAFAEFVYDGPSDSGLLKVEGARARNTPHGMASNSERPDRGCNLVNISEDSDFAGLESVTDRDPYEIMEEAEGLFRRSGIRISSVERLHEACVSADGKVLGASVIGLESSEPRDWDDLRRPVYVFSVAVEESARRRGIARALIESLLREFPDTEFLLEGKVVNPHMAALLGQLGFKFSDSWRWEDREDGGEEWTDFDRRVGRLMFKPNPAS